MALARSYGLLARRAGLRESLSPASVDTCGADKQGAFREEIMKTIALQTIDGRRVAREVRIADTFIARRVGWRRENAVHHQQGLLLIPGGSIHTVGMRFAVDVVFLDRRMRVLRLSPNVAPQSFRLAPRGTARVLELAAGRIAAIDLPVGTYIVVEHDPTSRRTAATTTGLPAHAAPSQVARPPIQFSLRRPQEHRGVVHSNLGCSAKHASQASSRGAGVS
jgi:uncharacterized membrane protein (UPF0127 family)